MHKAACLKEDNFENRSNPITVIFNKYYLQTHFLHFEMSKTEKNSVLCT